MPITLTKDAADEVRAIIAKEKLNPDETYLRVGVKGGGCSGFSYILDLISEIDKDKEEICESENIKIVCDPKSYLYVNGTSIDFKDGMMGRGFVFANPNSSTTCGCGSSFSV